MRSLKTICAAALLCPPLLAGAQQPAAPAANAAPANPSSSTAAGAAARNRRVRINVVVTDQEGTPVSGLTQQDFTVLDEQQARPIVSFYAAGPSSQPANPPVQAILVIDSVNLTFEQVSFARQQIGKFLLEGGGHLADPVSIELFTDKGLSVVSKPTTDGNRAAADLGAVDNELRGIRISKGFYGDRDRYNLSLRTLSSLAVSESGVPGRKLLIWMGPGWPLLRTTELKNQSNEQQQQLFNSIVLLHSLLRTGQITLYTVSTGGPDPLLYRAYLKGVKSPQEAVTADLGAEVLAIQTGGLDLSHDNDLAAHIAACLREADIFYSLVFDVPPAAREDEYHDLKVVVDKPGLTARTNTGYYNQP